ncbi:hypothetical protein A5722_01405 [Mycobacterium vulneris]|nr:hypothetical protein A5721_04675 [Mycolicibacterium vulneris]OCB51465.1 hypothetical protein A5722_01405 [Mycolicibacterium vulneris]OCB66611.1 hypothetical protein A5729_11555 [Mycolicibacterium vulneris]
MPQRFERLMQRSWVRHPLNDVAVSVGDGGQAPHTYVDTDPRLWPGDTGFLLRSLHEYPN